jgi:hypothetical protein
LRILILIVGLILILAIIFSLDRGFTFLQTALTIIAAQTILQGSYFLGLVARSVFRRADSEHPPGSRPRHNPTRDNSDFKAFDIPSRIPRWRRRFALDIEPRP